jgi:hypothetical protein
VAAAVTRVLVVQVVALVLAQQAAAWVELLADLE